MRFAVVLAIASLPLVSGVALCQSPTAAPPTTGSPPTGGKRAQCLQSTLQKGVRGMDRVDAMELCMAEARLDCVKGEIAKKMPIGARKTDMKACIGE